MDFQSWIEGIDGLASLYSFDIMPDGSFSEIRLMAVNRQNVGMLHMNPEAPEFYPGIPYRNFWMDLNFESFVYKCASTKQPLYSYVNARGVWLKGFYIPISDMDNISGNADDSEEEIRTVYCLYIITYSDVVETDSISQKSFEVAREIMDLSVKIHEKTDFYQAMAAASHEIKEFCGADICSIYIVDKNDKTCEFINENGVNSDILNALAEGMNRSPFEMAMEWEKDLALSDCLLLDDLGVIKERDPEWYRSLSGNGINNIILYAVRYNQMIVGYIWAANFDTSKMMLIKETLELTTFLIAAVIANHQLVSRLELKSTIDGLTQVYNRNAMDERVNRIASGEDKLPSSIGIIYADLNGLKTVNDMKGHDAGDKLLFRAAALLKITFEDYEIYRAGGDEFVIICQDITEDDIRQHISQLKKMADNTSNVSFAIGYAYCTGEFDINSALQQADEAMYQDKQEYYRNHPELDRRR